MLDHPAHPVAPAVKAVRRPLASATVRTARSGPRVGVAEGATWRVGDVLAGRRAPCSRSGGLLRTSSAVDGIFSFLFEPTIEATTWRAEQALRPAVVNRKMGGGGNRTARGAHTQHTLMSILRTADQRGLDSTGVLVALLRAADPHVPAGFEHAPPVH